MTKRTNECGLLALGLGLLVLAHTRWGVGALAWVAPWPLLAALRLRPDRRFVLAFGALFIAGWIVATAKIVTAPVPPAIALGYGIPIALVHLPAYLLWSALVRRGRDGLAVAAFAAATALAEWAQAELTPLGVWGATPTSQVGSLAVLQSIALVGMPGLSFLMNAVAAAIEARVAGMLPRGVAPALAIVTAELLVWGAVRADAPIDGPTVRAAMIRTDATMGGLPIPSAERRRRDHETLLQRSDEAATAGARLVVWPEAANLLLRAEERAYMAEASALARRHGIELVVSYILPVSTEPLRYENRARWFGPDGAERIAYLKHHPVPGEPAIAGASPAEALATTFGLASLAICYDYDFPALARVHARSGAGLVAVPSSDWRGIDPIHTEMAAMRAIEGGFSVVRSTRFGLSAGIDARGRLLAQQSTNTSAEPYVLATVPTERIATFYSRLGNAVLLPLVALLLWALAALRSRRANALERRGSATEAAQGLVRSVRA